MKKEWPDIESKRMNDMENVVLLELDCLSSQRAAGLPADGRLQSDRT